MVLLHHRRRPNRIIIVYTRLDEGIFFAARHYRLVREDRLATYFIIIAAEKSDVCVR